MRTFSACSIFIINASASHTFVLVNARLCVHIKKRICTKIKELIRLDALVAMRDMDVRARSPIT